jgi:hypothetical protein
MPAPSSPLSNAEVTVAGAMARAPAPMIAALTKLASTAATRLPRADPRLDTMRVSQFLNSCSFLCRSLTPIAPVREW